MYILQNKLYYVVSEGAFSHHFKTHLQEAITEKNFNINIVDVTNRKGIISIQGPHSRKIVEELTGIDLKNNDILPPNTSTTVSLTNILNGKYLLISGNITFIQ